jgi:hypothetical protein
MVAAERHGVEARVAVESLAHCLIIARVVALGDA